MRFGLLALIAALGSFSASAQGLPLEGSPATVAGRAHVEQQADGTRVILNDHGSVGPITGFVPFNNKSSLPDLYKIEGHNVQVTGVVNGERQITITDPAQIKVID